MSGRSSAIARNGPRRRCPPCLNESQEYQPGPRWRRRRAAGLHTAPLTNGSAPAPPCSADLRAFLATLELAAAVPEVGLPDPGGQDQVVVAELDLVSQRPFLTARPEATETATQRFKDWITSHARQLLAAAALLAGSYMVISGTLRLLS